MIAKKDEPSPPEEPSSSDNLTVPSAKVIADSICRGHRLTTFEVVMHRFVLAEMNTHRAFSRNSASSRAIPVSTTLGRVINDPAYPIKWPSEQKGMQGGKDLSGDALREAQLLFDAVWGFTTNAIDTYVERHKEPATRLHKSLVNRLLEPFMWHTAVISATDWEGFWNQRVSPLAQPEMEAVASAMLVAYEASEPRTLIPGMWHLPYVNAADVEYVQDFSADEFETPAYDFLKAVSVGRCARVSYDRQGEGSVDECLKRYQSLITADPPHASPLEHQATPCACREKSTGHTHLGNFTGWDQLRHQVLGA